MKIKYLGCVCQDTGLAHTGSCRQIGGRMAPVDRDGREIEMRPVEPTLVDLDGIEIPEGVSPQAGWGDRVERGETPPVWIARLELTPYAAEPLPVRQIPNGDLPAGLLDAIRARVAAAWERDIETRADVASVVEHYRSSVLDALDRQYAAHAARWRADCVAIARAFRRARVDVGEQTVPGKCCVRSTRGALLGYADVWNGVWKGTVQRI